MHRRHEEIDDARRILAKAETPKNVEAERATIGVVLRDPQCLAEISLIVQPTDFLDPRYASIFAAMVATANEGVEPDAYAVGARLGDRLKEIGGGPFLTELFDETLTSANAKRYAKDVQKAAARRTTIHVLTDALRDISEHTDEPEAIIADLERRLACVAIASRSLQPVAIQRVFDGILGRLSDKEAKHMGLSTGFYDLDDTTGGLPSSSLILLAARPSIGKTSLAMNIAENVGMRGESVLVFSLEMAPAEIGERMLAGHAGVDSRRLKAGQIYPEDMQRLADSYNALGEAKIDVVDCPGVKVSQIVSMARRSVQRKPVSLVVIDYLQLIEADERGVNRTEQVSSISRRLKAMARELKCPVLALSQLSRAVEQRGGPPQLSDLRDSGSLEQDADMVAFLSRIDPDDAGCDDLVLLHVAKNRNGPTPKVKLRFDKPRTRFQNVTPEWQTNPNGDDF